jgi:general secretion pathway protein K
MRTFTRQNETGIALVIVMIATMVLSFLAAGFAYSMKIETKLAQNANSESELYWLGRSGVELARSLLMRNCPTEPYDSLDQQWAGGSAGATATNCPWLDVEHTVSLGNGSFTWTITDLDRRFNINRADETMLERALRLVDPDHPGDHSTVVNSILDWIDADNNTRIDGAESAYYEGLNPPYAAKNKPIDDMSELLLIKGIRDRPEIYSADYAPAAFQQRDRFGRMTEALPVNPVHLKDLFTPISGGKININTARAEVLQLIPGIVDPKVAEAIVAGHQGEDDGSHLIGPYKNVSEVSRVPEVPRGLIGQLSQYCDVHSWVFQVDVDAEVAGYHRKFTALLARNSPRDIQVLKFSESSESWK